MTEKLDYRNTRSEKIFGAVFGALWVSMALVLAFFYEPEDGILYVLGIALFALMGIDHIQKALAGSRRDSFLDWFSSLP